MKCILMKEAFVYCWTDKLTNRLYVGSHKGTRDDGYICSSKWMLEEYNKRPEDFSRQIIADGDEPDIRRLEARILQSANAAYDDGYYNKHMNDGFYFAGWTTETLTETHRKNMSIAATKRLRTPEHMQKLHEGRRNSKNSPEHIDAIIKHNTGRKMSDEAKQKMSLAKKGKKLSEAHREKLRGRDYSFMQTEEYKLKVRESWAKRKGELVNAD